MITARLSLDLGAPVLEQLALVHLMADRDEVFRVRREQLAESRAALVSALADAAAVLAVPGPGRWAEPVVRAARGRCPPRCRPPPGSRASGWLPGPLFAPEGGLERFLRLPFTQSPEQLGEATERLARAWQETQPVRRTTRRAAPALVT